MKCKLCNKEMLDNKGYFYCDIIVEHTHSKYKEFHYSYHNNFYSERIFLSNNTYLGSYLDIKQNKYALWIFDYKINDWKFIMDINKSILNEPDKALDKIKMLMVFK